MRFMRAKGEGVAEMSLKVIVAVVWVVRLVGSSWDAMNVCVIRAMSGLVEVI